MLVITAPKTLHAKTSWKTFVGKATICQKSMSHFLNRQNDQETCFRIFQRARLMTFYKDAISIKCSLKTLHHYPAKPQNVFRNGSGKRQKEKTKCGEHCMLRKTGFNNHKNRWGNLYAFRWRRRQSTADLAAAGTLLPQKAAVTAGGPVPSSTPRLLPRPSGLRVDTGFIVPSLTI